MTDLEQHVTDQSDSRRYFHILENMADDDLDLYQYRLLGHYKRVCGANGGRCTESVRTTASKINGMGVTKVSTTRRELEAMGWINVLVYSHTSEKGHEVIDGLEITLRDRWLENVERFSPQTCSQDDTGCSPPRTGCSHSDTKEELELKNRKTQESSDEDSLDTELPKRRAKKQSPLPPSAFEPVFEVGQTVYVWDDKARDHLPCTVVKETAERVHIRFLDSGKKVLRGKNNVKAEKPRKYTLDDYDPMKQAILKGACKIQPGQGVHGSLLPYVNSVLAAIRDQFEPTGNMPTAEEIDRAFEWKGKYAPKEIPKILTMLNEYRDQFGYGNPSDRNPNEYMPEIDFDFEEDERVPAPPMPVGRINADGTPRQLPFHMPS